MSVSRPRLVVSGDTDDPFCRIMGDHVEVMAPGAPGAATADGFLLTGEFARRTQDLQLCAQGFLDSVPDALVLVDADNKVVWHNQMFRNMADSDESLIGLSFLTALGSPELISPAVLPLNMDPGPDHVLKAILKMAERKFVAIRASRSPLPVANGGTQAFTTIVVRDVSEEILENQKREALYRAGIELGDLSPDEVTDMLHAERTELLKEKILEYAQEILGFDTIEIRVLNPETKELLPLLEVGMQEEAATRRLFAKPQGNGVTGYVAATRQAHLCSDTQSDPLYLSGAVDARSSMTVPLIMHNEVLGTFNVESPGVQGFDSKDLEFLNVFGCVVAMALNQLQLLAAEKMTTATASSDRLRREIALPTDDILSGATAILEKYIGHDPDVCEKLQQILDNTRTIRGQIERVSEDVDSAEAGFLASTQRHRVERPALKGKRILVVDGDETVLRSAHELLDRHNCTVEAVRSGKEACQMARGHHYDVVLADIRLPDMNGYECFCQIQDIDDRLPVILMTGFGYDAGHSIVKSRQRGLKSVLYKPFRREQLLTEIEKAVTPPPPHE
ncbi:MAG: response regulator [Planctomycetaceae bacterium]